MIQAKSSIAVDTKRVKSISFSLSLYSFPLFFTHRFHISVFRFHISLFRYLVNPGGRALPPPKEGGPKEGGRAGMGGRGGKGLYAGNGGGGAYVGA